MKVNKKAAFSCSVPLDGEDVVVSSSSRGFCAFCRLLGNPLMPDLVIDRALGYVNLLLLLFFFLAPLLGFHCNFSPLFSPLLWWAQEMAWSQVKTEATMWYIIRSRTAQKFRMIVNWVWDPTDHVTFLPSSHPQLFTRYYKSYMHYFKSTLFVQKRRYPLWVVNLYFWFKMDKIWTLEIVWRR